MHCQALRNATIAAVKDLETFYIMLNMKNGLTEKQAKEKYQEYYEKVKRMNKPYDYNVLRDIADFIKRKAQQLTDDADYYGSNNNPGVPLKREVEAFQSGLDRIIPPSWEKLVKEYETENDPEYKEFLRLKQKFGNKQ